MRLVLRLTWPVALLRLAVGVRVAVQVLPPSRLLKPLNDPLIAVRSAVDKRLIASEKVIVTRLTWPTPRLTLDTTMDAVGRWVSMA
ncbi:hypothetical protein D3C78_1079680 [compost metagenome]